MIDSSLLIGTVRARAPADEPSARLRIERALAAADLRPPGLPAGAVLIVRHLSTAQPTIGPAWERAAREQLAALCRHAARPARSDQTATAEAVLFADRAELLACLADDIVADTAAARWWWRSYLRNRAAGIAQLPALLAADLPALPAALAMLDARGRAAAVLRALNPPTARALAERLATAFGAGPLSLRALQTKPRPQQSGGASALHGASSRAGSPIWPAQLPELAPEQHLLLGLALAIAARPATLQVPAFWRALAAWWHAADREPEQFVTTTSASGRSAAKPRPASGASSDTHDRQAVAPAGGSATLKPAKAVTEGQPSAGSLTPQPSPTSLTRPGQEAARADLATVAQPPEHLAPAAPSAPALPPAHRTATPGPRSQIEQPAAAPGPVHQPAHIQAVPGSATATATPAMVGDSDGSSPPPTELISTVGSPWLDFEGGIPTELGGALFLINLLIYLGLPEQFSPAWPLSTAVGSWGLLELLARSLLADQAIHGGDPLWDALARLDGRPPGVAPRAGPRLVRTTNRPRAYRPRRARLAGCARDYRIPARWLNGLPDDPAERYGWAANRRHLRIWSSRGYVLFDGHVRRPDHAAARAILSSLNLADRPLTRTGVDQPAHDDQLPALNGTPAWLRRWLALALPYIRLRLALALGLDAAADLAEPLLVRRGRLYISATHIDLVMSLASASVAVRLAGLDRNPGWMAEYGRVVLFHFIAPGEQEVW